MPALFGCLHGIRTAAETPASSWIAGSVTARMRCAVVGRMRLAGGRSPTPYISADIDPAEIADAAITRFRPIPVAWSARTCCRAGSASTSAFQVPYACRHGQRPGDRRATPSSASIHRVAAS